MTKRTVEVRRGFGGRPTLVLDGQGRLADIPAAWTIWNAPRPLLGHVSWQGEFHCGIFYAALDETEPTWTSGFLKGLVADDARILEFVGLAELDAYRERYLAQIEDADDRAWMRE